MPTRMSKKVWFQELFYIQIFCQQPCDLCRRASLVGGGHGVSWGRPLAPILYKMTEGEWWSQWLRSSFAHELKPNSAGSERKSNEARGTNGAQFWSSRSSAFLNCCVKMQRLLVSFSLLSIFLCCLGVLVIENLVFLDLKNMGCCMDEIHILPKLGELCSCNLWVRGKAT